LEPKRERVRKESKRVEAKRKYGGEVRDTLFQEGESSLSLEGSQAIPARPSDKDGKRVKILGS
jgi:hypothetical protein